MRIPEGMTEGEVVRVMENVANRLANKFKFGYHEREDMKQQAYVEAIKGLEKYNPKLPLENFLYVHVHNRLYNFKRDNYERPDKPCHSCPLHDPYNEKSTNQCEGFADKMDCPMYESWAKRNSAKKNLMMPIDIGEVNDEQEERMRTPDSVLSDICHGEIILAIDKYLPLELRSDWIRLKHEIKLPKARRVKLEEAIKKILVENNLDD